ncbi:hypothetical protein B296_00019381 [Ensete ventricosum]|uniref:Uncharacterized protein n=1 Tax=Ensete ventricosum TaxID=4639 RepID=A0A426Y200_ENSVE|nr:hypothetical protein B296_00019381 [Ensete ventricosum]
MEQLQRAASLLNSVRGGSRGSGSRRLGRSGEGEVPADRTTGHRPSWWAGGAWTGADEAAQGGRGPRSTAPPPCPPRVWRGAKPAWGREVGYLEADDDSLQSAVSQKRCPPPSSPSNSGHGTSENNVERFLGSVPSPGIGH